MSRLLRQFSRKIRALWKQITQRYRHWMRQFRKDWQEARRLERLGVTATIVAIIVVTIEITFAAYHTLGGNTLFYLLVPWFSLVIGLLALFAITLQRNGRLAEKFERLERDCEDERAKHALLLTQSEGRFQEALKKHHYDIQALRQRSAKRRLAYTQADHGKSHITRDFVMELFRQNKIGTELTCGNLVEYCNSLAEGLAELFDNQVIFRVAIKAYISSTEVVTVARDRSTRKSKDPASDRDIRVRPESNTAFLHLQCEENTVFACDNLRALRDRYHNTTPNWSNIYNSTMVVPIRRSRVDATKKFELAGHLAVDCLCHKSGAHIFCNSSGMPNEWLRNCLLAYADLAFAMLKRGTLIDNAHLADDRAYEIDERNCAFIAELHRVFVEKRWVDVTACYHTA